MTDSAFHIAVFCKAPVAGNVKTRLIPEFGAERAKNIYLQLAERTLSTARLACEAYGASASLWVADDIEDDSVQRWSRDNAFPIYQQIGVDLGARMLHCLLTMHGENERVLLIGTDCPAFNAEHLQRAAAKLSPECNWVFTPADDGGYVLVGSNAPRAEVFANITWSTSEVMTQTRAALSQANLRWAELETLWDVDVAEDVLRAVRNSFLLEPFLNMG